MRYSCYFAPYKLFCCSFHFQIEHKEPFHNKCESHEIEVKLRFQTDYNINEKHFCFLSPRKIFFKIVIRSHLSAAYFNIGTEKWIQRQFFSQPFTVSAQRKAKPQTCSWKKDWFPCSCKYFSTRWQKACDFNLSGLSCQK